MTRETANADYARVLLDEMNQFVGLLDTEGTLLEVNRTALEGGGLSASDVLGRPLWEAAWWQVDEPTIATLRRALGEAAQGQCVRYEVQVYGGELRTPLNAMVGWAEVLGFTELQSERARKAVEEALATMAEHVPDLVISDIGMPGEDGYSLIRRMRRSVGLQEVPAIALTAYASPRDRQKALRAGFQTHVVKPVDPLELLTVVASLTQRLVPTAD